MATVRSTDDQAAAQRKEFSALAERWTNETRHVASPSVRASHPAFLKLVAMGTSVVPLMLDELARRQDDWLPVLEATTDEDPASDSKTFEEAVLRWLAWGRIHGYIS